MASLVLTDASVKLGATDVSAQVQSITLNYSAEAVVDTAMGQTTTSRVGGVKDWDATIAVKQNYGTGGVDETFWALIGQTVALEIKPKSSPPGADNPKYAGTGYVESYNPIDGGHGELATSSLRVLAAGALARTTA